ncbi:MAG TPA: hypothetical protein GYA06_04280 [Chloroflexi bacterium]|nr:hypothetical protein [Chloroflexota bacterium]HPO59865.1 hypothetical protein [Anaerolineaceae bacterium]
MSKYTKRQARKAEKTAETAETQANTSTRTRLSDFNPDYTDVINDLKRIGTLAGTFFIILVALSFFLR